MTNTLLGSLSSRFVDIRGEIPKLIQIFSMLSKKGKRKVFQVTLVQAFLAILDLLAIAFIGLFISLSSTTLTSQAKNKLVETVLKILTLDKVSFEMQVLALGLISAVLLISKTVLSMYFSRRILVFLQKQSEIITLDNFCNLLKLSPHEVRMFPANELFYAYMIGIQVSVVGTISPLSFLFIDLVLTILIVSLLFIADAWLAMVIVLIFGILALVLHNKLTKVSRLHARRVAENMVKTNDLVYEILGAFKELKIRNQLENYVPKLQSIQGDLTQSRSTLSFMPFFSKYALEIGIVISGILVSSVKIYFDSAVSAISTLSVFLAATFRLAPAILRVQQNANTLVKNLAQANRTLSILNSINELTKTNSSPDSLKVESPPSSFTGTLELQDVTFGFSENENIIVNNLSFRIEKGEHVGIFGHSGVGKSTLVDLSLGILNPISGKVLISGVSPKTAIVQWPGKIAYVPQDSFVSRGSLIENITMGYLDHQYTIDRMKSLIKEFKLDAWIDDLPEGLATKLGDFGSGLSGGQRQRIALVRALLYEPEFIIFDEVSSSLDFLTQQSLTNSIAELRGTHTVVIIAHRIQNLAFCDRILHLKSPKEFEVISYSELKAQVKEMVD